MIETFDYTISQTNYYNLELLFHIKFLIVFFECRVLNSRECIFLFYLFLFDFYCLPIECNERIFYIVL